MSCTNPVLHSGAAVAESKVKGSQLPPAADSCSPCRWSEEHDTKPLFRTQCIFSGLAAGVRVISVCPLCRSRVSCPCLPVVFGDCCVSTVTWLRLALHSRLEEGLYPNPSTVTFHTVELPKVRTVNFLLFRRYKSLPWAVLKCPITIPVSFFTRASAQPHPCSVC